MILVNNVVNIFENSTTLISITRQNTEKIVNDQALITNNIKLYLSHVILTTP